MARVIERRFETLDAAIELASRPVTDAVSRRVDGSKWAGTRTFDEAVELARDGWSEIRADIDGVVQTIRESVAETVERRITRRKSVAGGAVNVAAMLSGDPRCMRGIRVHTAPKSGRVVKVAVNGCVAGVVDTERIKQRGAAIVALVEMIQASGCNSEVWVTYPNRPKATVHHAMVCVKSADGYLDVDAMTFAIAHPAMLRRIVFGLWEQESDALRRQFRWRESLGGYGRVERYDSGRVDVSDFHVTIDTPRDMRDRIETDPAGWLRGELLGLGLIRE